MKTHIVLLTALLLIPACTNVPQAAPSEELKLPALFQDHMLLQRNTDAPIWGRGTPGGSVSVTGSWDGKTVAATVGEDGKWKTTVATPDAGGPHTLTVAAQKTVVIKDVLIGEVWLCSGQSNMAWRLSQYPDMQEEIAAADHPDIRLFTVERNPTLSPQEDVTAKWTPCSPETVAEFSAVAYFFGQNLKKELGVPIGLVHSSYGGTPSEAWTDTPTLAARDDFKEILADIGKLRADNVPMNALDAWWDKAPLEKGDDWTDVTLPSPWSAHGLADFDGIVSYKRTFEIPAGTNRKDNRLVLGPIDNADEVRLNGKVAGRGTPANHARVYKLPGNLLKQGTNEILIRVADTGGEGGFLGKKGQFTLLLRAAKERIDLSGEWKMRKERNAEGLDALPAKSAPWNKNTSTVLYNGMIAPLIPFAIRGAIWYQGESNHKRPVQYRTLFPGMIKCWRKNWKQGDFPFLFVQIAPFAYKSDEDPGWAAVLRDAQRRTLSVPNTGMAVTMDIGNPRNIHPGHKDKVGHRLALWALAKTYGKEAIVYSGPLYREMKVEGSAIRISFDHVGGGLVAKDGPLTHFTIAGTDGKFVAAKANIDGETIVVSSPDVKAPVAVRYGHGAADEPNLFNKEGLPASSFMTDD